MKGSDFVHNFPETYQIVDDVYVPIGDDGAAVPFTYTDGEEFEDTIKQIIAGASDRSLFSDELRNAIWDWRSACHLSPVRANILRPLQQLCKGRVLELGSGCGIITRYLGELGGDVVALEASPHRASITRQRTLDLQNVRVVCDRIEDFGSDTKFDVVTMIGVLQYARLFSNCGEQAEIDLLHNAVRQLKDDGILVIAIQNKLGLKYFSGFPEPNVDTPYYGIENHYGPDTIIRFGLAEIRNILSGIGLESQHVLLPLPDYHMPVSILAPNGANPSPDFSGESLIKLAVARDRARPDWIAPSFSLEQTWSSVYNNELATDLANSFLIVASKAELSLDSLLGSNDFAWHYSVGRHPAFATGKRFTRVQDTTTITREYLKPQQPPAIPITHHVESEPYLAGPLWWDSLVKIVNTPGWSTAQIGNWAFQWIEALCEHASLDSVVELSLDQKLPGTFFDLTPLNCIEDSDGKLQFFDKEWEVQSPLSLSYLIVRGVFGSLATIASCAKPAPGTPVQILDTLKEALRLHKIYITENHIEEYITQEFIIQNWVNKGSNEEINQEWIDYLRTLKLVVRLNIREIQSMANTNEDLTNENRRLIDENKKLIEIHNARLSTKIGKKLKKLFKKTP